MPSCRRGRASSTGRRAPARAARRRRWWRRIRCRSPTPRSISCVVVHGLEMSDRPNALMAELRRVLTGGGRLIVVVPNRQGPWASTDLSPFGFGRPYSRGQLRRLFAEAGFEAESWTTGLHMAPASWRPLLRGGARLRQDRADRLAGFRRRDRRRGGKAHGAGHHHPRALAAGARTSPGARAAGGGDRKTSTGSRPSPLRGGRPAKGIDAAAAAFPTPNPPRGSGLPP